MKKIKEFEENYYGSCKPSNEMDWKKRIEIYDLENGWYLINTFLLKQKSIDKHNHIIIWNNIKIPDNYEIEDNGKYTNPYTKNIKRNGWWYTKTDKKAKDINKHIHGYMFREDDYIEVDKKIYRKLWKHKAIHEDLFYKKYIEYEKTKEIYEDELIVEKKIKKGCQIDNP